VGERIMLAVALGVAFRWWSSLKHACDALADG